MLALFFAAMLGKAVAAPSGHLASRVLTSRVLMAFGKYSYALYLVHILVRDVVQNQIMVGRGGFPLILGSQLPAQLALVAFGIGVSYAIAFASWHLFEKRILALKRFFPYECRLHAPRGSRDRRCHRAGYRPRELELRDRASERTSRH